MEECAWRHDDEKADWRSELSDIRKQIDEIDMVTASLLEQRLQLARRAGAIKNRLDMPIKDGSRESEVLERVSSLSSDRSIADAIRAVYRIIIRVSSALQDRPSSGRDAA